jgi:hypothetical protein
LQAQRSKSPNITQSSEVIGVKGSRQTKRIIPISLIEDEHTYQSQNRGISEKAGSSDNFYEQAAFK